MNNQQGCNNGHCWLLIGSATGQHTNGGCNCLRELPVPVRLAVERKIARLTAELAAAQYEILCRGDRIIDLEQAETGADIATSEAAEERDEAREAARTILTENIAQYDVSGRWTKYVARWPWLEEGGEE